MNGTTPLLTATPLRAFTECTASTLPLLFYFININRHLRRGILWPVSKQTVLDSSRKTDTQTALLLALSPLFNRNTSVLCTGTRMCQHLVQNLVNIDLLLSSETQLEISGKFF